MGASIKDEGAKDFYYGENGAVEVAFSKIESELAPAIARIIDNKTLPLKDSREHEKLLWFCVMTDMRNPTHIDGFKGARHESNKKMLEIDETLSDRLKALEHSHDKMIGLMIKLMPKMVLFCKDLDFKILQNDTPVSFVSSDFPIIKYNQFLEDKLRVLKKSGLGTVGIQIFMPLSPEIMICFFDGGVYKVGNKKQTVVHLTNENDVNQLNILQMVNCFEKLYFNETITQEYVQNLNNKASKYSKANQATAELAYLHPNKDVVYITDQDKNLIITGTSDCEIGLNLSFLKVHSKGKSFSCDYNRVPLRPKAMFLMQSDPKLNKPTRFVL